MPSMINPLQTSFVSGRSIDENIIITKEVAHIFHKAKRGRNIMALKIDLPKAFDSLKWGFIRDTLIVFAIPDNLVHLIMSLISSSNNFCLWNGEVTQSFKLTRGIRQGGPLFSYIFVLCLERLTQLIDASVTSKHWKPLAILRDLSISHLFYVDDVFLFGQASNSNLQGMIAILQEFVNLSGLHLNEA